MIWKFIGGCLYDLATFAFVIFLVQVVTTISGLILEFISPGYLVYDAVLNAQWVILLILVWNQWFGPYAKTYRKVAKLVDQAQEYVG